MEMWVGQGCQGQLCILEKMNGRMSLLYLASKRQSEHLEIITKV